jgi:LytR cell envelope-related transcriptional attenuator
VTTPGAGGGPSPLRLGGLGLIGVAVVAAIIGLASMATNGGPATTVAPSADASNVTSAPATVPPPAEPLPTDAAGVPVPSFTGEPAPGAVPPAEPAPGAVPPGAAAPAPAAPGGEVPPGAAAPQAAPDPGAAPAPAPDAPGAAAQAPAPGAAPAPQQDPGAPAPQQAPAPAPSGGGGEPMAAPAPAPSGGGGGDTRTGDTRAGRSAGGTSVTKLPLRVYNNSTISGLATRAADDFRNAGWPIDEIGNYPQGIIPTTTVYYRPGTEEEAPAKALAEQFGMRANPRFEGIQQASPGIIVIVTNDYGKR